MREKLSVVRKKTGKSQLDVMLMTDRAVGMSRISLIENDRLIPTDKEKDLIAGALGVSVDEIAWPTLAETGDAGEAV